MFQNIGTLEVIIIASIVLLMFGAKKLPEFARGLVSARKEFDKGMQENNEPTKK